MTNRDNRLYKFGRFLLKADERLLLRGSEALPLTPKALETLIVLVERSGHVVSKDELMEAVWQDTFVEENGLTRNISVLRKVLGQSKSGDIFIETIPKVGYRFVAEVEEFKGDLPEQEKKIVFGEIAGQKTEEIEQTSNPRTKNTNSMRRRAAYILGACLLLSTLALIFYQWRDKPPNTISPPGEAVKSIAVFPFKPIAAESTDESLQVGIADALITRLSSLRQISVKPTSAVRRYVGDGTDALTAGRELGVDTILEGSIQRSDEKLRITVQLVKVGDGSSLWADKFDARFTDIFAVQDEIAEKVVSSLKIQMDAAEQTRVFRRYTENVEAYEAYLRGRALLTEYTKVSTLASLDAFQEALALDPGYVLARDGLATASAEMYLRFATNAELKAWGDRAEREISLALATDPNLAETHQALAAIYRKKDFNWEKVIEESDLALQLNPNLEQPHYYRSAAFYHLGLLDLSDEEAEKGIAINPQNRTDFLRAKGIAALYAGKYSEAVLLLEEVQRLSSKPLSDSHLALAYYYQGEPERAEAMLEELSRNESASASARARAALASFLAARGARKESLELLKAVKANYIDHHVAYSVGATYTQLGQITEAIRWLRRAGEIGLPCFPLYERDKLLEPIRGQNEFQSLLNELRESQKAAQSRYGSH